MKLKKLSKSFKKMNAIVKRLKQEEEISQLDLDLLKEYTRDFYQKLDKLGNSKYLVNEKKSRNTSEAVRTEKIESGIGSTPEQQASPADYNYRIGQISDKSLEKEATNLAKKVAKEQKENMDSSASTEEVPSGKAKLPTSNITKKEIKSVDDEDQPLIETDTNTQEIEKESDEINELEIPSLELEIEEGEITTSNNPSDSKAITSITNSDTTIPKEESAQIVHHYKELFELEEVNDLSDKLSNAPIGDIRSSMGLNERVLTINELFGGNAMNFDKTVKALNQMDNFDQAKAYLAKEIIPKYDWDEEDKLKKAKVFLKLIRRRYNLT